MIVPRTGSFVLTSESVTPGHPDKVADRIADAVLDAHLEQDPDSLVACEVLVTGKAVVVAGERSSLAQVSVEEIVRSTIRELGYDRPELGFWDGGVRVSELMTHQSPEIRNAVVRGDGEIGAGDQGLMTGFACDETPERLPLPLVLAHRLARRLGEARRSGEIPWLRPDGKTQVSVRYEDGRPAAIAALVVSCQHDEGVPPEEIRRVVEEAVIAPALEGAPLLEAAPLVNPSGSFVEGGPVADTGLTGRKLAVDTYGGVVAHGGGALSGKDATKVDRSGAYAARQAARAVVDAGLARRAAVQLAYAIGRPEPVAVSVLVDGADATSPEEIPRALRAVLDFRPRAVIERLGLRRPLFSATSSYGHFGRREDGFAWEETMDIAGALRSRVGTA